MTLSLRSQLRIALAVEGITIRDFAARHHVSDMAIHNVLSGKRSKRMEAIINGYIDEQFAKLKISRKRVR